MIHYRMDVRVADGAPSSHLFRITMTVADPGDGVEVSLPAWIPGSYLVREFARHVSQLRATQSGQALVVSQKDKHTWQIPSRSGGGALRVEYLVYAFDTSVRAAFLDAMRGFFNGTSVFMRVAGRTHEPHHMLIGELPQGWRVATAMTALELDANGRGTYVAADYDEFADHPVELGHFWVGGFESRGVPHEFVVAGAWPDFDGDRLLADAKRICDAEIHFWHGEAEPAPFARYVFLLNAVDDGYGGLEHRASTALICARRDLPRRDMGKELSDGYVTLLGLISHEYFHTWNVKRLKPREFALYDYQRENYSQLLWFFEGFTSYYDDLLLLRAGLIDAPRYLKLLAKTINTVLASPGRKVQSVAQASFDAWVKYYRTDENTPNATISYYAKGSLVALALDLQLQAQGASLDAVMRALWEQTGGGPIDEADIAAAIDVAASRPMGDALQAYVHGTDDLPLEPLLKAAGIAWTTSAAPFAQRLGVRVAESALTGVKITHVLRGGIGEAAGLSAGDEVLAVDGWRLRRLEDAQRLIQSTEPSTLLISRDQKVLSLPLPAGVATGEGGDTTVRTVALAVDDKAGDEALARRRAWLGS